MAEKKSGKKVTTSAGNGADPEMPVRLRPRRPCPICDKASAQNYHPFCSARCADVDLHRWLGERYRIAGTEPLAANDDEEG